MHKKSASTVILHALLTLLVCAGLFVPLFSVRPAAAQAGIRFDPAACMVSLPAGVREGEQVQCGYLTVPTDYQDESKGTIRLAVVILKATGDNPAPDPLVMAQGGPGGSTIDTYTQIMFTSPLLQDRDIILFDQRGTLYSQPALYCTEMDELTAQTIEQDISPEESNRLSLEAMARCHDRLVKQGVDLSAFNSLDNAQDIEALRQALGIDQIDLYGVSYGTLLAQHYMRLHPGSLRSVVLDAVVPTQTNFVLNAAQTLDRSLTHLFETCKAEPTCNAEYPDLEKVFFDLVDQLNREPARIALRDYETLKVYPQAVINGDTFQWFVFQLLYAGDIIPMLPRIIYDAKNGDFQVISAIMPIFVFDRSMSYGMYYSVLCAEDTDFSPADQNLEGVRPQVAESEKDQPQILLDTCNIWKVETLDAVVDEPVVSQVPTLLLSGGFDPITPPEYAAAVAQNLAKSYPLVFPAGGHGQFISGACADGIVKAFLVDPSRAPDAACIQDKPRPEFITNANMVKMPALYKALQGDPTTLVLLLLLLLGGLFLGASMLVFPLAWMVNRLSRRVPAAGAVSMPAADNALAPAWETAQEPFPDRPRLNLLDRISSWLPAAAALLLGVFLIALVVIGYQMVMNNDNRLLYGLGSETRPLFILPVLFVLTTIGMLAGMARLWMRADASVMRRLYYSLLALTGFGCSLILAWLGTLGALF